jgi:hypothetical protein
MPGERTEVQPVSAKKPFKIHLLGLLCIVAKMILKFGNNRISRCKNWLPSLVKTAKENRLLWVCALQTANLKVS